LFISYFRKLFHDIIPVNRKTRLLADNILLLEKLNATRQEGIYVKYCDHRKTKLYASVICISIYTYSTHLFFKKEKMSLTTKKANIGVYNA
jgi:hypothetical protein